MNGLLDQMGGDAAERRALHAFVAGVPALRNAKLVGGLSLLIARGACRLFLFFFTGKDMGKVKGGIAPACVGHCRGIDGFVRFQPPSL